MSTKNRWLRLFDVNLKISSHIRIVTWTFRMKGKLFWGQVGHYLVYPCSEPKNQKRVITSSGGLHRICLHSFLPSSFKTFSHHLHRRPSLQYFMKQFPNIFLSLQWTDPHRSWRHFRPDIATHRRSSLPEVRPSRSCLLSSPNTSSWRRDETLLRLYESELFASMDRVTFHQ